MKNILLIFTILFVSYSAYGKNKHCGKNCCIDLIKHNITYSNKGTKSEARHGHLSVKEKELADFFTLVIFKNNTYKFHQRSFNWGNDGYFPFDSDPAEIKTSGKSIDKTSLDKGWYTGSEKLEGTPCGWLFVKWDISSAFVSPEAIDDLIETMNLKKIPRFAGIGIIKKAN